MTVIDRVLSSNKTVWGVLAIHFLVWLTVGLMLDVHPDMADHWVWSRFLRWGYYEHPPMVAFLMRLATLVPGSNVLILKVGAIAFSVLILYLAYRVGLVFFDRKTALVFILILETAPYFSAGSILWHIDQPYMVCWLLSLWIIGKFIDDGNHNWIFAFGVVAGMGALSKYIMILFPVSLGFWCLLDPAARRLLWDWRTYLAALIALAIAAPNIYWNYQNDWITFQFVYAKGLTGSERGENFIQFFFSQFLLFSLVYTIYVWWALVSGRIRQERLSGSAAADRSRFRFILMTGLLPFGFFALSSFKGGLTDPHWVNVAYFSLFLMLARHISLTISRGRVRRQLFAFGGALSINLLLVGLTLAQVFFRVLPAGLPEEISLKKLVGWTETARQIEAVYRQRDLPVPPFVISREYQTSSALSLYIDRQPFPHSIEKAERNAWSPVAEIERTGAALVCPPPQCPSVLEDARERFSGGIELLGEATVKRRGNLIRRLRVYHLHPTEKK